MPRVLVGECQQMRKLGRAVFEAEAEIAADIDLTIKLALDGARSR